MKNIFFKLMALIYSLATLITILIATILFITRDFGYSLNDPNFIPEFMNQTFYPCLLFVLFMVLSFIILFVYKYKKFYAGYAMIILLPLSVYLSLNFYRTFPAINLINLSLEGGLISALCTTIFWLIVDIPLLLAALIPFYVLGKLLKHDLAKK